ncbi:hypothetical protein, partial [Halosimplex amylolyticum]|uniref:hypothetical protein n=1 Tax=Halosimplex amylolyticum TaxID=3396616 RepID=UPI003F5543D6
MLATPQPKTWVKKAARADGASGEPAPSAPDAQYSHLFHRRVSSLAPLAAGTTPRKTWVKKAESSLRSDSV